MGAGARLLTISTQPLDLSGKGLVDLFSVTIFVAEEAPEQIAYRRDDPRLTPDSTTGNRSAFHGLSKDPETGFVYFRNRYYDPEMGRFITADPLGYVDGPSMYQFAMNSPTNCGDPLGLTSKSDIKRQRLIYTWHIGWLDANHMESKALVDAWNRLRKANSGEKVLISISLDQGTPGELPYKQSTAVFRIEAAPDVATRKRQLLAAWMILSEQFESYQGSFPQGIQATSTVLGWYKGEQEKVGSSFSTEDLVSNLVAFQATVEGRRWQEIVAAVGGRLPSVDDEKQFAYLLWDCTDAKIRMGGGKGWRPKLLTPDLAVSTSMHPRPDGTGCMNGPSRYQEFFQKYQAIYGQPTSPSQLEMEPEWRGVEAAGTLDD